MWRRSSAPLAECLPLSSSTGLITAECNVCYIPDIKALKRSSGKMWGWPECMIRKSVNNDGGIWPIMAPLQGVAMDTGLSLHIIDCIDYALILHECCLISPVGASLCHSHSFVYPIGKHALLKKMFTSNMQLNTADEQDIFDAFQGDGIWFWYSYTLCPYAAQCVQLLGFWGGSFIISTPLTGTEHCSRYWDGNNASRIGFVRSPHALIFVSSRLTPKKTIRRSD